MSAYGTWASPVTPELVAGAAVALNDPWMHGGTLHWLESRPAEGGRVTLLRKRVRRQTDGRNEGEEGDGKGVGDGEGGTANLPPPYNVRSRVHEYGGGAYLPTAIGVFFVNFSDQNIYLVDREGAIRQITHSPPGTRYADLCHDPRRQRLIAVTEMHDERGQAPENALAAVSLADGAVRLLHRGHDFYAAPRLSADGEELLCIAWDHPNMPWDGTLLLRCRLAGPSPPAVDAAPAAQHGAGEGLRDGDIVESAVVAGGDREAVMQPVWAPDGAVLYIGDQSGFWNLHRLDGSGARPLLREAADYGGPAWQFGQRSYVCLNHRLIAAVRHAGGRQQLVLIDAEGGFASPLVENAAGCAQLSAHDNNLYFLAARSDGPAACVRLDMESRRQTRMAQPPPLNLPADCLSAPEHVAYPTRDGAQAYAYVYRPRNPDHPRPSGRPPLMVLCHGGPTGAATPALNLLVQFYTSRGWTVADVDYRGSSGYGRAYREALKGRWGEVDVADCEDAVRYLTAHGQADPNRVAIRGRSAGGYTTLRALTTSPIFKAGASHYGVADLAALDQDTHKFESRYLDGLLGAKEALAERSPIHHLDGLACPLIFFQGGQDKIVPPSQAQAMVEALRRKGLPVAYIEFPEEGHGFRDGDNIARCIGAEYAFFCRVFGLPQPEDLPELEVENL